MRKIIFILLCSFFVLSSCESGDDGAVLPQDGATLIFGFYAGECTGDCSDIYLIDDVNAYVDVSNSFPNGEFFSGDFQLLSQADFNAVKDLFDFFPVQLLEEASNSIGCPDCADQGAYYVEYETESFKKSWNIDTNRDAVPAYLHDFLDAIDSKNIILGN